MASWNEKGLVLDPTSLRPYLHRAQSHLQSTLHRLQSSLGLASSGRRRGTGVFLIPLGCILFLIWFPLRPPLPPSYKEEYRTERYLEQNELVRTMEGEDGAYVRFKPIIEEGFNYQLQNLILQQHVAFLANKSLAFEPYHISDSIWPFSLQTWPLVSSRVPMTACLSSISSGFEATYTKRRAVPVSQYQRVCPSLRTKHISFDGAQSEHGMKLVVEVVTRLKDQKLGECIEVDVNPFDRSFFEGQGPIDLYESLAESPVMSHFSFSPRVLSVINKNLDILSVDAEPYTFEPETLGGRRPIRPKPIWKNVLALHLRQSTDPEYCFNLGMRNAPFVGFNKLPRLPGNENVPAPDDMVEPTRLGLYRAKCNPSTLEIIARARRMRMNHPLLDTIYILNNGDYEFIAETRKWLESEGWLRVLVSGDVINDWQDQEIGEAVETEIARRAGVFVGNGFSPLSSNVALLRNKDGLHTDLTQYW